MSASPHSISVQNLGDFAVNEAQLQAAAALTLAQHPGTPPSALTVVIAADDMVRALNQQYRGVDAPTDVLSFPADPLPPGITNEPPYLGDLIIAYPYAAAQAAREGHAVDDSLALLVIHGVLHLLGYDHDTRERRTAMWTAQTAALQALNIPVSIVPSLEGSGHDDAH